jgi:hypothetical protein
MTSLASRSWLRHSLTALPVVLFTVTSAHAQTAKELELEARIQQLEKLVSELTGKPVPVPEPIAAAPAPSPQVAALQTQSITPNAAPGTRFSFTGYVKLDTLFSKYSDGEIADGTAGRDFYLPATIPVGGADEDGDLDAHVKQSRFIFGTDSSAPNGSPISTRLEVDLFGSALGDERVTNAYGVLLRQVYVQSKHWLVGQAWSNFQDVAALPETADFIGPTDGTTFVRQPQIRYINGGLTLSAENPETTVTPFGGGTRISSDDNDVPDLTATYTFNMPRGYLRTGLLARQLKLETTGMGAAEDTSYAAAVSVSGRVNFGANDLRFMVTGGDAIGRYVGVNFANDAVLTGDGRLRSISGWAAFAAWKQNWNPQLRSTLMLSASEYDNDVTLTGGAANKGSLSLAVNTFYTLAPKLDLGLELRYAEREIESGADGSLRRLQAIVKYSF